MSKRFDLLVPRHPALRQYLYESGLIDETVREISGQATEEDVEGRNVVGVLPHHLSSLTLSFSEIPLPYDHPEAPARGEEWSLDHLRRLAGPIQTYVVRDVGQKISKAKSILFAEDAII